MRYVKKPIVVNALRYDGTNADYLRRALEADELIEVDDLGQAWVQTLEGRLRLRIGDWVVQGIAGEVYPVRDEIFARTYQPYPHITLNARLGVDPGLLRHQVERWVEETG